MGMYQDWGKKRAGSVLQSLNWHVNYECAVETPDGTRGLIDVLAFKPGVPDRIAVEVELQGRRVAVDVAKAEAARATECLILVPNKRVARAAQKRLQQVVRRYYTPAVYVVTLPEAIAFITSHPKSG